MCGHTTRVLLDGYPTLQALEGGPTALADRTAMGERGCGYGPTRCREPSQISVRRIDGRFPPFPRFPLPVVTWQFSHENVAQSMPDQKMLEELASAGERRPGAAQEAPRPGCP